MPGFMQHFWPAMLVAWVVAAIFGVLLGAPTLRLRGDYLAILTLGYGEIVPAFFTNASTITRGPQGIGQIARPPSIPLPRHQIVFDAEHQRNWYWLIILVVLFSLWLITRLYDSGSAEWQAIREDEIAAASMGISLTSTKPGHLRSASFSGFAGAVIPAMSGGLLDQFQFSVSTMILAMVILGVLATSTGDRWRAHHRVLRSHLARELNEPLDRCPASDLGLGFSAIRSRTRCHLRPLPDLRPGARHVRLLRPGGPSRPTRR